MRRKERSKMKDPWEKGIDRIVFFSDAVFAIAITLLVLELKAPTPNAALPAEGLNQGLIDLVPKLVSYLVSFFVIGLYWVSHHRLFRFVARYDPRLMWLNLLLLFCVAFLPFPSALVGSFGGQRTAVILFAGTAAVLGFLMFALWRHIIGTPALLEEGVDRDAIRRHSTRSLGFGLIFAVSVAVAFVSAEAAIYVWYAAGIAVIASEALRNRIRRPARRHEAPENNDDPAAR
jgi:uncharacterized membrane protein